MYFPAFYITKDLVMSDSFDIGKSLSNCRANLKEDLIALWKIWVPAMIINFSFMPMYARIPFVAGVSLLWTCILSSMRGGDVVHGEEMAGGAVTGATLTMMQEGFVGFFHTSVDLDKDMSHLVLTASGPDKPGWVAMLAASVAKEHGNVTHSKMVRLGNEFIILMHVATPPGQTQSLIKSLQKNPDLKPLNIRCTGLTRRATGEYSKAVHGLRIHCIGEDRYVTEFWYHFPRVSLFQFAHSVCARCQARHVGCHCCENYRRRYVCGEYLY
jgi:predicted amino acid-binding ACT domain protein